MSGFSFYTLLILVFLGLSKGFLPSQKKILYIADSPSLDGNFPGEGISLIVVDAFQVGLLIKTHYLKLKVFRPFEASEFVVVRTSKAFWHKAKKWLGMSILRRGGGNNRKAVSLVPLPAGSGYVGNDRYGAWKYLDDGGRVWRFHDVYEGFSKEFYWGGFLPDREFYETVKRHQKNKRPFFGLNGEFGEGGTVTGKEIQLTTRQVDPGESRFKKHLDKLLFIPPWKVP